MAIVALPRGYDSAVERAAATTGDFSNLRQFKFSYSGSVCAFSGMNMVHQLVWQLCLPLVMLVTAFLIVTFLRMIHTCARLRHRRGNVAEVAEDDRSSNDDDGRNGGDLLTQPLLTIAVSASESQTIRGVEGVTFADEETRFESATSGDGDRGSGPHSLSPAPLASTVACLGLFSFTSFSESVLRLLDCASVSDNNGSSETVLYYAGAVECHLFPWQWSVGLLLAVLLIVPSFVVGVWAFRLIPQRQGAPSVQLGADRSVHNSRSSWSLSQASEALGRFAQSQQWPNFAEWRAVLQHAAEPFREECWSWAAVLMLQRLFTVMCRSLHREAAARSMGITMVSFGFAMLHVHVKPFHSTRTNQLQLLALVCLTLVSLLNGTRAVLDTAGINAASAQAGPLAGLVKSTDWAMLGLLLLPLLMVLADGLAWLRSEFGRRSSGTASGDGSNREAVSNRLFRESGSDSASGGESSIDDLGTTQRLLQIERRRKHQALEEKQQALEEKQQALTEKQQALAEKEEQMRRALAEKEAAQRGHRDERAKWAQQMADLEQRLYDASGAGAGAGADELSVDSGGTRTGRHAYSTFDPREQ